MSADSGTTLNDAQSAAQGTLTAEEESTLLEEYVTRKKESAFPLVNHSEMKGVHVSPVQASNICYLCEQLDPDGKYESIKTYLPESEIMEKNEGGCTREVNG